MKVIKLTRWSKVADVHGLPIYFNARAIRTFGPYGDYTWVYTGGDDNTGTECVQESAEEIVKLLEGLQ